MILESVQKSASRTTDTINNYSMIEYTPYVEQIEYLLSKSSNAPSQVWQKDCYEALNGGPSRELQRVIDLDVRRSSGIFFTGLDLANRVFDGMHHINDKVVYFDPACGTGDLLLAIARKLPVQTTLTKSLEHWGRVLIGLDKFEVFVRATRIRLALLAINRGSQGETIDPLELQSFFPNIRSGDGLLDSTSYKSAQWIVMNPPFSMLVAPNDCTWAKGKVSAASLFLEMAIEEAPVGSRITAILPDVLRSGTRYRRWRQKIESQSTIKKIQLCGIFDKEVDIDVFLLNLVVTSKKALFTKKSLSRLWKLNSTYQGQKVGDHFDISVGSVVPHRDRHKGPEHFFIHAHSLPKWTTINSISETRLYDGKVFESPFVVVRRTSRPGDKKRAIGTIIDCKSKVAIENHLLVLAPKDRTVGSCKALLYRLISNQTDNWLNQRIRCRHLTVSALNELPWWESV